MNSSLIEYMVNSYNIDRTKLISAISIDAQHQDLYTPCWVCSNSLEQHELVSRQSSNKKSVKYDLDGELVKSDPPKTKEDLIASLRKALETKDVETLNEIAAQNYLPDLTIRTIFPFTNYADGGFSWHIDKSRINQVYFIEAVPLIEDTIIQNSMSFNEFLKISGLYSKKDPYEFRDFVKDLIEEKAKCRAICLNLKNLNASFHGQVQTLLLSLLGILDCMFKVQSTFPLAPPIPELIVDTMDINIYELTDVIPIYDFSRAHGIVLDVVFYSERLGWDKTLKHGYYKEFKRIYSSNKENIQTIDGGQMSKTYLRQLESGALVVSVSNSLKNALPYTEL